MSDEPLDLQTVIGAFFVLLGAILLSAIFFYPTPTPSGFSGPLINGVVGGSFALFGLLLLALRRGKKPGQERS